MLYSNEDDLFDFFDQQEEIKDIIKEECEHVDIIQQKNVFFCSKCGKNIQKVFNQDRDWKYSQNRLVNEEKNIFKDIDHLNLDYEISIKTNYLYNLATSPSIFRGKARRGIISACIFYSHLSLEKPVIFENITNNLNITRKDGLKGLKFVSTTVPSKILQSINVPLIELDKKGNSEMFFNQVDPKTFIFEYLEKLKAKQDDIQEVLNIYYDIINKAGNKLERNRPQSVAAGIIYFWILRTERKITLKNFAKTTLLSELTITKIEKIIVKILK